MNDDLRVSSVADGIHRIAVPTPFIVGRINVYVFDQGPLTIVDTGPNSGTSLDALDRGLQSLGHSLDSVERILLTHQHVDHTGLAGVVARRSGAEVAVPAALGPYLQDWTSSAAQDDRMAASVMRRHGLSGRVAEAMEQVAKAYRAYGDSVAATTLLRERDLIEIGGRSFTVYSRPGHSPTDTVFVDASDGLTIGGDHLLEKVSSNPVLSRALDPGNARHVAPEQRFRSLPAYVENLKSTREMQLGLILPGHGDPFQGHVDLISERLEMHEKRAQKMLDLLSDEPLSALDIAEGIWGETARSQPFLTFSEVIGHMDLLADQDLIRETPPDDTGTVLFQAS